MSVVVPTLWADHSRCDLEFEDWSEIFENQTEGLTMTDWNQTRIAEPEVSRTFTRPPSEDEEEDNEEDEDGGITAETRSHPIPYQLVWMEEGSDALTPEVKASDHQGGPPHLTTGGVSELEEVGSEDPEEQGTLDTLEVLEVEEEVQDDTRWLYESPLQPWDQEGDPRESALSWSRRLLDHPSPDMEAACRVLNNILDKKSRAVHISSTRGSDRAGLGGAAYGRTTPPTPQRGATTSPSNDWSASHSREDWGSLDYRLEDNRSQESKQKDDRSQDLTDLRVLAREQEASLHGEPPHCWSQWAALGDITNLDPDPLGSTWGPPASSPWRASPYFGPSANRSLPQLRKLQHRVTEYKLLTFLQSKEAAVTPGDGGPAPLLRTSLRSLQAARKSRSLESAYPGPAHYGPAHYGPAHHGPAHYSPIHADHIHPDDPPPTWLLSSGPGLNQMCLLPSGGPPSGPSPRPAPQPHNASRGPAGPRPQLHLPRLPAGGGPPRRPGGRPGAPCAGRAGPRLTGAWNTGLEHGAS